MSQIFSSTGIFKGTKTITSKVTGNERRIAIVNFGRTNNFGFQLDDEVFLIGDQTNNIELVHNNEYSFSLIFNTKGQPILDRKDEPVLDADSKPRSFDSDSIACVQISEFE